MRMFQGIRESPFRVDRGSGDDEEEEELPPLAELDDDTEEEEERDPFVED